LDQPATYCSAMSGLMSQLRRLRTLWLSRLTQGALSDKVDQCFSPARGTCIRLALGVPRSMNFS